MATDESHDDRTQSLLVLTAGTPVSHYRVIEKIGAGGMGEVYLAEDTELDRKVALKFLPPHLCQDEDCRKRFKREAQAAAKLNHPHIITIYEVGECQGRPFIAMEHVDGRALREYVAEKDLSIERILELGIQIGEGLQAAHEKGVTHRDIKPSNILFDAQDRPRIGFWPTVALCIFRSDCVLLDPMVDRCFRHVIGFAVFGNISGKEADMNCSLKMIGGALLIMAGILSSTAVFPSSGNRQLEMILVHGGTFRMGDVFGDGEEDEKPAHDVSLDSYYINKYEVTVGEFREFVEATGYKTTAELDGGAKIYDGEKMVHDSSACWRRVNFEQTDSHPVVCVTWYDAIEYCNWRSKQEGLQPCYQGAGDSIICDFKAKGYRLPTEAEFEFAARSRGKDFKYAWGNGDPLINGKKAANIRDETARRLWGKQHVKTWWKGYDDGFLFTSPVGSFAPNELGVCDLSGNVYEWCWDWYDERCYETSPKKNPLGATSGTMRCCRDVGYGCLINAMRAVNRGKAEPGFRFLHGGFRLYRSAH